MIVKPAISENDKLVEKKFILTNFTQGWGRFNLR